MLLDMISAIMKSSVVIAAATTVVVIISAAMILGIQNQTSDTVLAQTAKSNATTRVTTVVVTVTPSQTTNKTFWISTVHLDGATSLRAGVACGNCSQN